MRLDVDDVQLPVLTRLPPAIIPLKQLMGFNLFLAGEAMPAICRCSEGVSSRDRKKALNDTRSYPISVKLQILELAGQISFEQFSQLDELRKRRNEIVHPSSNRTSQGDRGSCGKAFELLRQFIASDFNLPLVLNRGYSHTLVFDR